MSGLSVDSLTHSITLFDGHNHCPLASNGLEKMNSISRLPDADIVRPIASSEHVFLPFCTADERTAISLHVLHNFQQIIKLCLTVGLAFTTLSSSRSVDARHLFYTVPSVITACIRCNVFDCVIDWCFFRGQQPLHTSSCESLNKHWRLLKFVFPFSAKLGLGLRNNCENQEAQVTGHLHSSSGVSVSGQNSLNTSSRNCCWFRRKDLIQLG